jgi:DNA-binding transcriptional ArsR family regulator
MQDIGAMRHKAGEATALLKALANEHRLLVLCALAGGERSVGDLNGRVELSQSALSQHLAVLRSEGLVATRREGQAIYYSLADPAAARIIETLYTIYCAPVPMPRRRRG